MTKKLLTLLLLFTVTLTASACSTESPATENIDKIIANNIVEQITFPTTELEGDLVLPNTIDGYTLTWTTTSPSTITSEGQVTRPSKGDGNSIVTLTVSVTSKDETVLKDFIFTVLEETATVTEPDDNTDTCPLNQHLESGVCVDDTDTPDDPVIDDDDDDTVYTYEGYYEGLDGLEGELLKAFLHDLIDDHTVISYGGLRDALQDTDEDPDNPDNIILFYSGVSVKSTWDSGATWNREHSWPKSLGGFASDDAGSDLHHIRATYTSVNSARGNKMYDNGGTLVSKTTDCYTDGDSFEPRDEVKGDVARMMFYMAVRYEGYDGANNSDLELVDNKTTSTSGILGNLQVLLQWNIDDPVDELEMNRNEAIYGYQHNRNPFIDHPELVELIWGN